MPRKCQVMCTLINAKWNIPGKLIECIAVIFFLLTPPFNLRHVYSLLHHFAELGKNKLSLSFFFFSFFTLSLLVLSFLVLFIVWNHQQPGFCMKWKESLNRVDLFHPCAEGRAGVNFCLVYQLIGGLWFSARGCRWQHLKSCVHFSCGHAFYCQWLTLETLFVVIPNHGFPVFSHPVHSLAQKEHLLGWRIEKKNRINM